MKRPKLEILDPEDIQKIITAAYDLLENFGVMVDNDEALEILEGGGAGGSILRKKLPKFLPAWWTKPLRRDLPGLQFMIRNVKCRRYWKKIMFILSRGPGMMAFANCQSPEKLVVDNNICGTALRFIKGVACNEETLAVEVIKDAGRDAQEYLTSSHTMKWFKKELFFPTDIIHRRSIREGEREDSTWERAKAEVTDRLDKFIPVSLPEDKIKEIMRIMQSYAGSKGVDVLPHVGEWVG